MRMSEKLDLLAKAVVEAQKEMPHVKKDAVNPFFKSKYSELSTVIETCQPILNKHGLAIVQLPDTSGEHVSLCTMLMHTSGQFIAGELLINAKAQDPQAQGSAITYARRYAYMGSVGAASSDDDGEAAMQRKEPLRAVVTTPKPVAQVPQVVKAASNQVTGVICDCGNQMMLSVFNKNELYCNPKTGGCGAKRPRG